ncbi:MAG: isopentenyl phosphate kinase family protein [Chloroflexi bacterium]|nr:isopentenyl phosphate kinase family protein [Chloroflexota bacterium]
MGETVFLKLGGSLITDKRRVETPRLAVIQRVAKEIASALEANPELRLVLGHGSGSFGHFSAERHKIYQGNPRDWRGYAETAAAAQRLNRLVTDTLLEAGVPVVSLQPSASARCHDGALVEFAVDPVVTLLEHGLVPLVYGDVALDDVKGCTILSTEQILVFLARQLRPQRIIVAGEVAGVYSGDPQRDSIVRLLPEINSRNYGEVAAMFAAVGGAAAGVDVTGGMASKVRDFFALVQEQPTLTVHIVTGRRGHLLERMLADPELKEGTVLRY